MEYEMADKEESERIVCGHAWEEISQSDELAGEL